MSETRLSNCCNSPIETSSSDEGTGCYICTKCKKGCDPVSNQHKEKAQEIVDKYFKILDAELLPINDVDCRYQAKQCALIHYRRLLNELNTIWNGFDRWEAHASQNHILGRIKFYKLIKKEIENL